MGGDGQQGTRLCQVALSATTLRRTLDWYCRALGFRPAGAFRHLATDGPAYVSGLPECTLNVACIVDCQEAMQFEIIEFERPRMRLLPADWRPSDQGYSTIGLHVEDFDAALARLARTSGRLLTAPLGEPGQRRVCLRDPEGILLELMESDFRSPVLRPRPHHAIPVCVRSVTVSVPSLERAHRFWVEGLGCVAADVVLHGPEHERLWGLEGAHRDSVVLWAGDILIELVSYRTPRWRPRPAGYLISDQGILNIAFGCDTRDAFNAAYERLIALGYAPNSPPWVVPERATVVYFTDDQGVSVEVLYVEPEGREYMGFVPNRPARAGGGAAPSSR